jgi:hypothetical protein
VTGRRRAAAVAGVALVLAASAARWFGPFTAGHRFGVSGGPLTAGRAVVMWFVVGVVAGLVALRPGVAPAVRASVGRAWRSDDRGRLHLAGGVAAGAAVVVVGGAPLGVALAFGVLVALAPGWSATTTAAVVVAATAVAAGAAFAAILPTRVAALVVVVAAGAWVAYWRRPTGAGGDGAGPASAVVALAVVAAAATLLAATPAHAQSTVPEPKTVDGKKVTVRSDEAFVSTGITVATGQWLQVTAKGTVEFLHGVDDAKANPDGFPARFSGCGGPGFCGVLVGRIAGGAPFLIGSSYAAPVAAAGPLELGVNDYDPRDNDGSFKAVVSVGAPPVTGAVASAATPDLGTDVPAGRSSGEGGAAAAGLAAALGAFVGALLARRAAAEASVVDAAPALR